LRPKEVKKSIPYVQKIDSGYFDDRNIPFFGEGQKTALAIYMRGRKKSQKNEKKD